MTAFEIILIIVCVLIVVTVFGTMIYKKIKGIPNCDCGCGSSKGNKLLKQYHKKYQNDKSHECCCHCHDEETKTSSCCCKDETCSCKKDSEEK